MADIENACELRRKIHALLWTHGDSEHGIGPDLGALDYARCFVRLCYLMLFVFIPVFIAPQKHDHKRSLESYNILYTVSYKL